MPETRRILLFQLCILCQDQLGRRPPTSRDHSRLPLLVRSSHGSSAWSSMTTLLHHDTTISQVLKHSQHRQTYRNGQQDCKSTCVTRFADTRSGDATYLPRCMITVHVNTLPSAPCPFWPRHNGLQHSIALFGSDQTLLYARNFYSGSVPTSASASPPPAAPEAQLKTQFLAHTALDVVAQRSTYSDALPYTCSYPCLFIYP